MSAQPPMPPNPDPSSDRTQGPYGPPGAQIPQGQPGPYGPPQGQQGPPPRSGDRVPRKAWLAIIGGVAVLGLLLGLLFAVTSSGGPSIENDDGKIVNAEGFLRTAERDWRSSLPTEGVEIADGAGCFFVLNDEELITGQIACGGARRIGAGDGEVWDVATFTVEENDGDQEAAGLTFTESGVVRPKGQLVAANGDEAPEALDDVEAPPLPAAEAGAVLAQVPTDIALTDEQEPGEAGKVITPGGVVTVSSVAATSSYTVEGEDGSLEAFGPAEGEEFRVVSYSFAENEDPESTPPAVTLGLESGGQLKEIVDLSNPEDYGTEGAEPRVLVSVPADDPEASLVVSSAGHDQHVDLATGERKPDPVADTYYRKVTRQDVAKSLRFAPHKFTDTHGTPHRMNVTVDVDAVELTPYVPEAVGNQGWAEEGKAWLVIHYAWKTESDWLFALLGKELHSWQAAIGKRSLGQAKVRPADGVDDLTAVIAVPADTDQVTISAAVKATLSGLDVNGGFANFPAESFDVRFPK